MIVNDRIFEEINYVYPDRTHKAGLAMTDEDFISEVLEFKYPQSKDESDSDYEQRLLDELTVYPIIGTISDKSLLAQYLNMWHNTGHFTSLVDTVDYQQGAPKLDGRMYFLTCNTNYNVIDMDLFGGDGNGRKEVSFLKFVNNAK